MAASDSFPCDGAANWLEKALADLRRAQFSGKQWRAAVYAAFAVDRAHHGRLAHIHSVEPCRALETAMKLVRRKWPDVRHAGDAIRHLRDDGQFPLAAKVRALTRVRNKPAQPPDVGLLDALEQYVSGSDASSHGSTHDSNLSDSQCSEFSASVVPGVFSSHRPASSEIRGIAVRLSTCEERLARLEDVASPDALSVWMQDLPGEPVRDSVLVARDGARPLVTNACGQATETGSASSVGMTDDGDSGCVQRAAVSDSVDSPSGTRMVAEGAAIAFVKGDKIMPQPVPPRLPQTLPRQKQQQLPQLPVVDDYHLKALMLDIAEVLKCRSVGTKPMLLSNLGSAFQSHWSVPLDIQAADGMDESSFLRQWPAVFEVLMHGGRPAVLLRSGKPPDGRHPLLI